MLLFLIQKAISLNGGRNLYDIPEQVFTVYVQTYAELKRVIAVTWVFEEQMYSYQQWLTFKIVTSIEKISSSVQAPSVTLANWSIFGGYISSIFDANTRQVIPVLKKNIYIYK